MFMCVLQRSTRVLLPASGVCFHVSSISANCSEKPPHLRSLTDSSGFAFQHQPLFREMIESVCLCVCVCYISVGADCDK